MKYSRYSDRRNPTWSLVTGTARSGYAVTALNDLDPSAPHWIEETTIRVVADMGSALEVQAMWMFAHNFDAGLNVRLQANATNVWTSPSLNVPITIETAYRDGFAVDAEVDLTHLFNAAIDRTYRYWSIVNTSANSVSVSIGEVWLASEVNWFTNNDLAHDYALPFGHLVSESKSKRGVQTVYDMGTRERSLTGRIRVNSSDLDTLLDWDDDQHGKARPMVVVLDEDASSVRLREPRLVRFTDIQKVAQSLKHDTLYDVSLGFDELGRGEVIGA